MGRLDPTVTQHNHGRIQVIANISINAKVARRLVNVQLMKKVGQLIVTGEPEIAMDGEQIDWKVPLFVVPPDGDDKTYPLKQSAFVDAISGIYIMEPDFIEKSKPKVHPSFINFTRILRSGIKNDKGERENHESPLKRFKTFSRVPPTARGGAHV